MTEINQDHRLQFSRAFASWFVRRDGKYYDIDNCTVPLTLPDVQGACIARVREEFADIPFSIELLKAAFKIAFTSLTAPEDERIGTWNGKSVCQPASDERLAPAFNAKSLNIATQSTAIMQQVQEAGRQISTERLREYLDGQKLNCLAKSELLVHFRENIGGNIESVRHKMLEIGWSKYSLKWGGVDHKRALWVRNDYTPYRGQLRAPDGSLTTITSPMEEAITL